MLPKALKSYPKSNKSPNLVTLQADENSAWLRRWRKYQISEDRKRLGLTVFRLGTTAELEIRDVGFWCESLPILEEGSNRGNPVCHGWIRSVAAKLNLPNRQILDLLVEGKSGTLDLFNTCGW